MEFELILPCYNEAKSLSDIIVRAVKSAEKYCFTPESFKLVLVENGSKDNSREVLQQLSKSELGKWFRVVYVDVNQGYGFGLWSGLKTSQAKIVGWSHADQQCDPENAFFAHKLLTEQKDKKLVIKGKRFGRDWKDKSVSFVFEWLATLILGRRLHEINAQPKVFYRELLNEIKSPPKDFAFDIYVLYCALKSGHHLQSIPVLFPPRVHGVSNWAGTFLGRYNTIKNMVKYILFLAKNEGRL